MSKWKYLNKPNARVRSEANQKFELESIVKPCENELAKEELKEISPKRVRKVKLTDL